MCTDRISSNSGGGGEADYCYVSVVGPGLDRIPAPTFQERLHKIIRGNIQGLRSGERYSKISRYIDSEGNMVTILEEVFHQMYPFVIRDSKIVYVMCLL